MWPVELMPDGVPWPLLIRAKYVHEIDAVLKSIVFQQIVKVGSPEVVRSVAEAFAAPAGRYEMVEATADQRVAAFTAVLDWEDWWCPTPPVFPWPPRRHLPGLEDLGDPAAELLISKAVEVLRVGGSAHLHGVADSLEQVAVRSR